MPRPDLGAGDHVTSPIAISRACRGAKDVRAGLSPHSDGGTADGRENAKNKRECGNDEADGQANG